MTLSRLARECVTASAFKSNFAAKIFEKNASGVPRPSNGIFWSLSHKSGYVAGVVSKQSVGIDLEELKTISDAMFKRIVDQTEFSHFGHQDKTFIFFRVFTAKEAVLKKTGEGMKGLSNIKIDTVSDDNNLIVQYRDKKYRIENIYFDGYLASVTKDNLDVEWSFK